MISIDAQTLANVFRQNVQSVTSMQNEFLVAVKPHIKEQYLSHLLNTVEDLVNQRRLADIAPSIRQSPHTDANRRMASLLKTRNIRPYSILLYRTSMASKLADVHFFEFGATISYDSRHEDADIRIAIAHELGHIFVREYLRQTDTEEAASIFAYIAMQDKNNFYTDECKSYVFPSASALLARIRCLQGHVN